MYQFIQHQHELTQILIQIDPSKSYALDSEFIKVDTLWPKLGVFQININESVYLLDGITLDLTPFWQKIQHVQQTIFHACSEDIDLIYYYSDVKHLDNVFDTQLAMAFLGYGLQVSYQNALKMVIGIDIEKDQTRSNWLARPLTQDQLMYATNDVLYLPQLGEKLQYELKQKQLLAYVLEDCANLTKEIGTPTPKALLYTDVGHYKHSRRQLMQLQILSQWREELTQQLNVPKSFILKNAVMIDLVEKNPRNLFQLAAIKNIRSNVVREYGKHILELLKQLPEQEVWPPYLPKPVKQIAPHLIEEIEHILDVFSYQTGIPKAILMRKKWMNELHYHVACRTDLSTLSGYLTGWRYECLTAPIIEILQQDRENIMQQMRVNPR